ncbi:MAG: hypothetical protein JNL08_15615, partial [Planctomycetes bacterium]|nr:hypothetical protein [Planctomycetota bacterium]
RAKGSLFDGGGNVPLLVRGPAVTAPGTVATELVAAVDLFPTLLAMCGAGSYPPPSLAATALPLDGQSVLPALAGQPGYGRPFVYCEITGTPLGGGYTLRSALHRLVRYTANLPEHQEFYNLVADPNATTDLLAAGMNWISQFYYYDLMTRLEQIRDDGWAEQYGTGCPGSAGVPFLRTETKPRIGQAFVSYLATTAPTTVARLTLVGASRTMLGSTPLPLPLDFLGMPGCQLLSSGDWLLWHNVDGFSPPFPLPWLPALYGLEFFVQGIAIETGANPAQMVASRGLRCVIGR